MVTSAKQWKSKSKTGEYELELPSGNTALVRGIRPEAFLESGLIPDPLQGLIQSAINSKKGLPPSKVNEIAADPKKLAAAMEMFDRVLVYCVIEPSCVMPPLCDHCGERENVGEHIDKQHDEYHKFNATYDEDVLYADQVDLDDKQFIFQWSIGGVADLETFRKEQRRTLQAAQAG